MNLSGFCAADQGTCGAQPGPGTTQQTYSQQTNSQRGSDPTYAQLADSPYRNLVQALFSKVTAGLWNVAASIGRTVVCPLLPSLGASLGTSIGIAIDLEEITVTGPGGLVYSIGIVKAAELIGKEAGLELQRQLCS